MLSVYRRHGPNCPQQSRRYRRCNCPCWAEGTIQGKYVRRALKVRSWERAQQIVRDIEERGESGERITIDQACSAFVDDAKARGLRPQSVYKYELIFRRLKAFARQEGIEFINECSLEFLRKFRATWNHRNYAIRNKTENLRALFRFAYDAKWIKDNPSKNLKSPQTLDAPTVPFTGEEIDRILAACESYKGPNAGTLKAFVLLLRHSGLRIRDAVLLNPQSRDRRPGVSILREDRRTCPSTAATGVPAGTGVAAEER